MDDRTLQVRLREATIWMLRGKVTGRIRVTHMGDGTAVIEEMWTPPDDRGRGFGSGRLAAVCARADADRETLVISPTPTDPSGMSRGQLVHWLLRMGFVPNQGVYADRTIAHSMYRRPDVNVPTVVHDGGTRVQLRHTEG